MIVQIVLILLVMIHFFVGMVHIFFDRFAAGAAFIGIAIFLELIRERRN